MTGTGFESDVFKNGSCRPIEMVLASIRMRKASLSKREAC